MTALRGLQTLLICLIILPVLVYSNHFSQETFATAATEDLDPGGNSGDNENNNDSGQGGSDDSGDSEAESGGLAEGEGTRGLAEGDGRDDEDTSGGLAVGEVPPPEPRIFPHSSTSDLDEGTEGPAGDDDNDGKFRHNAEDIAMELSSLSQEEIREYPITDLSDNDIILVFGFLNPGNLTKVLLNIPQEDLADIRDRLTPVTFTESLSKLSGVDRSHVSNRLVFTTIN
jgi:hypothetical protein